MEIHQHTHTPRKKWTHYFWEFLMLFLAVFCGFLAENYRETRVEHHREKQYMRSLIQDLQEDTKDIDKNLQLCSIVTEKLDSLIFILDEKDPDENACDLYRLGSVAGRIVRVSFNDRTSSQLKNAGTMRLIRNSDLSDSIQSYWTIVKIAESVAQRMENIQSKASDISVQMTRYKYFGPPDPSDPFVASVSKDAKLINSDPKLIAQLSNHLSIRLVVLYNYVLNINQAKAMALRLIALIKKEYYLK